MTHIDDPSPERREHLVWNPLWREYSVQSPGRMRRREGATDCPFCADLTAGRIGPGVDAWIRPNDFPALTPPNGECLILIYSRDHYQRFADLTIEAALRVVGLWRRVYDDLSQRYSCVMSWETYGAAIGQTQAHPHGQTYGVSVVPELLQREMESVLLAEAKGQPCPFCATVERERVGTRCVYGGEHWIAFVPPWARYPYQTQIVPRQHFSAVDGFDPEGDAARELAMLLPRLIRGYDLLMEEPMPYMLALHQLGDTRFHFHIELMPVGRAPGKLKLAASAEMAWGFWLNDALADSAAETLRSLWTSTAQQQRGHTGE